MPREKKTPPPVPKKKMTEAELINKKYYEDIAELKQLIDTGRSPTKIDIFDIKDGYSEGGRTILDASFLKSGTGAEKQLGGNISWSTRMQNNPLAYKMDY